MSTDDLQRLCFITCFNSIRTRTVISIPTPVRYADLCAYRSKLHIEAQRAIKYSSGDHGADFETDVIEELNKQVKLNPKMKDKLFYC